MSHYDYYRRHNPSMWGRSDYVMGSPPAPRYQPQPQWRGGDYYRAHTDSMGDSSLFDNIWGRLKSHSRSSVSRREAESVHRRVYGGLVDLTTMMPAEIGSAAGYEAWRFWEHHRGIYRQPLMDDRERESEALVGLAVGEAEKLWEYTRRYGDRYGKREALETAAAVAMKLYRKGGYSTGGGMRYEEPYVMRDPQYNRRYRRRSSSASPLDYDDSDYDRDYSDYGRSPGLTSSYHLGSPSIASAVLPDDYRRRRASSTYYDTTRPPLVPGTSPYVPPLVAGTSPYIPPLDSALSPSAGAVIIPPHSSGHYRSGSHGAYGIAHDYRDETGQIVHRTTYGDPTSEYSHLAPGTYVVSRGSGGRSRRRSHSGRYH